MDGKPGEGAWYTWGGMSNNLSLSIPIDSPFVGRRDFVRADGTSFWQFLDEHKIEYQKSHFPFLTNHKIPKVQRIFNFKEYLELGSRGAALAYLYAGLGKAFNYVGPVLDQELKHGFNDHTDRHTLWVSQTAVELLARSGYSFDNLKDYFGAKSEVLVTLVGMTHDLGNFMDRKQHSTYSAWLLTRLFDNYEKDPQMWGAVLHAVLFHEEPVLRAIGSSLQEGTPMQWALVAADKMHMGRDRIGGRSFASGIKENAFEEDVHILLNSLVVRSSWYFEVGKFVWHLDFSVDQLEEKFASFTKGNQRLWVPWMFQRLFVQKGRAYRDTFSSEFSKIYGDRMRIAAECVFLLYPFVDAFEVRLTDTDTRHKVGSGEMSVWHVARPRPDWRERDSNRKVVVETVEHWWGRG